MATPEPTGFKPAEHLMNLKGKEYLPVAARVLWFRSDWPAESGWAIRTQMIDGSFEKEYAVFRAEIVDPEGRVIATGTNAETKRGFPDFLEKSETSAIGRALATLGYGTMAALDEGEVVDAPQGRELPRVGQPRHSTIGHPSEVKVGDPEIVAYQCQECGKDMEIDSVRFSQRNLNGRVICGPCRKPMLEAMKAAKEEPLPVKKPNEPALCVDCGSTMFKSAANASFQALGFFRCEACQKAFKERAADEAVAKATANVRAYP